MRTRILAIALSIGVTTAEACEQEAASDTGWIDRVDTVVQGQVVLFEAFCQDNCRGEEDFAAITVRVDQTLLGREEAFRTYYWGDMSEGQPRRYALGERVIVMGYDRAGGADDSGLPDAARDWDQIALDRCGFIVSRHSGHMWYLLRQALRDEPQTDVVAFVREHWFGYLDQLERERIMQDFRSCMHANQDLGRREAHDLCFIRE